jgi:hypothetical protein
MPPRTPAALRLRAAIAAETRWAKTEDRTAATKPGRDAWLAKLEALVDPDGRLLPDERRRRAVKLRRAHMLKMSAASARARALPSEAARWCRVSGPRSGAPPGKRIGPAGEPDRIEESRGSKNLTVDYTVSLGRINGERALAAMRGAQ